jgi:hypothetical protein
LKTLVLLFSLPLFALGCCSANAKILPKGKNTALIISSSSDEDCCYEKANEKAAEYCKRQGKSYIVVNDESNYKGMDKTAKGVLEGAGAVMGSPVYLSRSDDYRVRMTIKCTK